MLTNHQRASLALWYVVNASLSSYDKLIEHYGDPIIALNATPSDWQNLSIHKNHCTRLADMLSVKAFLRACEQDLVDNRYGLVFVGDDDYPTMLADTYDPPPLLFYRGNVTLLNQSQLAVVGTRKPSDYAKSVTFDIAQYLVQAGFVITSGLAEGVDAFAHKGALTQSDPNLFGKTVGVMGTGIDVCYPKSHRPLFDEIVANGGCLISEFIIGTQASKHTFPRRNRLVAGLSLATLVTEATMQSGSLITARLTAEQGKQVFALPGRIDNPQAEGCHHLIREGATLIYHPKQIVDELNCQSSILPKTFVNRPSILNDDEFVIKNQADNKPTAQISNDVPERLLLLFNHLTDELQDVDSLVERTGLATADILGQLIELELMGLVNQIGGRYGKS